MIYQPLKPKRPGYIGRNNMEKIIYKGFIKERPERENDFALFIGDGDEPVAKKLEDQISGKQVSVKYFISDSEKTIEELTENFIRLISGDAEAEYSDAYSEYTGYLWTDEKLYVGGHDLMWELHNNIGRFIYIEIEVHQ